MGSPAWRRPSIVESEYGRTPRCELALRALEGRRPNRGAFDLVSAFEVLEHALNPAAFLAELSDYVAPGGYLVIGTDNFESGVVRALGPGFPKWIPHTSAISLPSR